MKTIIYHNPRCSKCREALCLLEDHKEDIEIREYLQTPPSKKELQQLIKQLGIKAEQLVRKSEGLYKENFADRKYTGKEWIDILTKNPILIERPIVIKNNKAIIGRPPQLVIDIL
jgi:arsenate reductase